MHVRISQSQPQASVNKPLFMSCLPNFLFLVLSPPEQTNANLFLPGRQDQAKSQSKSVSLIEINISTLLSANTTVLKYILVNPFGIIRVVKVQSKHNLPNFCVSFLFAEACYAVSLLCVSPSPHGIFCRLFERILVTNANKRLRGVPENLNVLEQRRKSSIR